MPIQVGNIILFRKTPGEKLSGLLSWILQRFEPHYTREFWHTAPVVRVTSEGCYVLDAGRNGLQENFYSLEYIQENCRVFHWFDSPPDQEKVDSFVLDHKGDAYDYGAYVGTVFFYAISRIFGRSYRVFDPDHTCWEITSLACRVWGKPLQPIYEYPLISSMQRVLERNEQGGKQ